MQIKKTLLLILKFGHGNDFPLCLDNELLMNLIQINKGRQHNTNRFTCSALLPQ